MKQKMEAEGRAGTRSAEKILKVTLSVCVCVRAQATCHTVFSGLGVTETLAIAASADLVPARPSASIFSFMSACFFFSADFLLISL